MKKVFLLLFHFIAFNVIAQTPFNCGTSIVDLSKNISNLQNRNNCVGSNEIKYIKINFHYVLRADGTGNWNETSDGTTGPNFLRNNGYYIAEKVVERANYELANSGTPWMSSNTTTARPKIRYVLSGVYFHRSDYFFNKGFRGNEPLFLTHLGVDPLNTINVFETNFFESFSGYGPIVGFEGTSVPVVGFNMSYNYYISTPNHRDWLINNAIPSNLNHEIGHNLGLLHSWVDDGCTDTYSNNNCWAFNENVQNCDDYAEVSNNVMGYNQYYPHSYTACQVDIINASLNGDILSRYVSDCGNCMPVNPFYKESIQFQNISEGISSSIIINASASVNESHYQILISRTNQLGTLDTNIKTSTWRVGPAGNINLRDGNLSAPTVTNCVNCIPFYDFVPNQYYRVTLRVKSSCGTVKTFSKIIYLPLIQPVNPSGISISNLTPSPTHQFNATPTTASLNFINSGFVYVVVKNANGLVKKTFPVEVVSANSQKSISFLVDGDFPAGNLNYIQVEQNGFVKKFPFQVNPDPDNFRFFSFSSEIIKINKRGDLYGKANISGSILYKIYKQNSNNTFSLVSQLSENVVANQVINKSFQFLSPLYNAGNYKLVISLGNTTKEVLFSLVDSFFGPITVNDNVPILLGNNFSFLCNVNTQNSIALKVFDLNDNLFIDFSDIRTMNSNNFTGSIFQNIPVGTFVASPFSFPGFNPGTYKLQLETDGDIREKLFTISYSNPTFSSFPEISTHFLKIKSKFFQNSSLVIKTYDFNNVLIETFPPIIKNAGQTNDFVINLQRNLYPVDPNIMNKPYKVSFSAGGITEFKTFYVTDNLHPLRVSSNLNNGSITQNTNLILYLDFLDYDAIMDMKVFNSQQVQVYFDEYNFDLFELGNEPKIPISQSVFLPGNYHLNLRFQIFNTPEFSSYTLPFTVLPALSSFERNNTLNSKELISIVKEFKHSLIPNPVNAVFQISNDNDDIKIVEVYDIYGKLLIKKTENFSLINSSELSTGIYLVKIIGFNNEVETKKIIKN